MYSRKNRLNIHMRTHVSLTISKIIFFHRQARNLSNVHMRDVQRPLPKRGTSKHIWEFIQGKNLSFVNSQTVRKHSQLKAIWQIIWGGIRETDRLNARFARPHLCGQAHWRYTSEDTLEKNLLIAIIVENNFRRAAIWRLT
jgi:hypothetical protein